MSLGYALDGIFSIKSDIFSFGVVLLEIISGKNTGFYQSKQAMSLLIYVSVLNFHNHLHSHHILFRYRLCRCVNFSNNLRFGNFFTSYQCLFTVIGMEIVDRWQAVGFNGRDPTRYLHCRSVCEVPKYWSLMCTTWPKWSPHHVNYYQDAWWWNCEPSNSQTTSLFRKERPTQLNFF